MNTLFIFLLAIYIRIIIEAYLYLLLSLVSEVTSFTTFDAAYIVSFVIAVPMLVCTAAFFVFVVVHFIKFRKTELTGANKMFEELYANVKDSQRGRLYMTVFVLRRTLMVAVIVSVSFAPVLLQAVVFTLVQILTAGFMLLRPLESVKDNLIEGMNDVLIALITLIFTIFYQESSWTTTLSNIIVYVLIVNGFVVNIIIIIDFVMTIIKVN